MERDGLESKQIDSSDELDTDVMPDELVLDLTLECDHFLPS